MTQTAHGELEVIYRTEARRVRATLIRLVGGFEAAEEGLHEAFLAAAASWPLHGVPRNPYSWLGSAGRNRVVDRWRREAKVKDVLPDLAPEPAELAVLEEICAASDLHLLPHRCRPMAARP